MTIIINAGSRLPSEPRGWTNTLEGAVTGVTVNLETHGIDDMDAYTKQAVFSRRVYWNGSSSSNPSMDDFAAPGFVMTYRKVDQ